LRDKKVAMGGPGWTLDIGENGPKNGETPIIVFVFWVD